MIEAHPQHNGNAANNNNSNGIRQNLVNPPNQHINNIELGQIPIPNLQPLQMPHPNHFPQQNQFQQAIMNAAMQRTIIPIIPISAYKYYLQICVLFGCLIEIFFFKWVYLHFLWITWYVALGYWRHLIHFRKIRFWGQFCNLILWIITNFYVFGGGKKQPTVFPYLVLLLNTDFYFMGSGLFLTYFCFISYFIWQCIADIRLRSVARKLQERKKVLIQNLLQKFSKNQQLSQINEQLSQKISNNSTIYSVQGIQQEQIQGYNEQSHACAICLDELKSMKPSGNKNKNQPNKVLRLECSHRYHYSCIKQWIQTDNEKCPICRRAMFGQ